jgi:hypothetical protein
MNSNTQAFLYTIPNVAELTGHLLGIFQISYLPLTSDQAFFKCAFRQSVPSILPSILVLVHLSLMGYLWFKNITEQFSAS